MMLCHATPPRDWPSSSRRTLLRGPGVALCISHYFLLAYLPGVVNVSRFGQNRRADLLRHELTKGRRDVAQWGEPLRNVADRLGNPSVGHRLTLYAG